MDEYTVLCEGAIGAVLDGARGAGDLPAEPLTAPMCPHPASAQWYATSGDRQCCDCGRIWCYCSEAGPSPCCE